MIVVDEFSFFVGLFIGCASTIISFGLFLPRWLQR